MAQKLSDADREDLQSYFAGIESIKLGEDASAEAQKEAEAELIALTGKHTGSISRLLSALKSSPTHTHDDISSLLEELVSIANNVDFTPATTAGTQLSLFPEDQQALEFESEVMQTLPRLNSTLPESHLIPNSRLANSLPDIINTGLRAISVSPEKSKSPIDIVCDLVYEGDNLTLSGRQSFTEYDRNVYNAISSLFVYGDPSHIITPATVYRAMTNMTNTEDPSPQQIGAVTRSIEKMRFTRAKINCKEQFLKHKLSVNGELITDGVIDTYLLAASGIQVQAGGKTVRAYLINDTPVIYAYSSMLKQVLKIPAYLLDIKVVDQQGKITESRISNTESRIQVKGYLLRRIEGMKGKNALKNNTIALQSYEKGGKHHAGLYEIAGLDSTAQRRDQKKVRDYAEQALTFWKACGYIKGFSFCKEGKTVKSIKIDP